MDFTAARSHGPVLASALAFSGWIWLGRIADIRSLLPAGWEELMILLDLFAIGLIAFVSVKGVEWGCRVYYGAQCMFSTRASAEVASGEWRIYAHIRNHSTVPMRFTLRSAPTTLVINGNLRTCDYHNEAHTGLRTDTHTVPALGVLKFRVGYGASTTEKPPVCGLIRLRGSLAYIGRPDFDIVEDLPLYYDGGHSA
jgi:hypothetical protein